MLPIYYTNVARRTDRRGFMEGQFQKLGLTAERIDAITPDRIAPELLARHCGGGAGRHSPGDLACNLSHQLAWRALLASGAPAAVVFEDDGLLSPRLPAFLGRLEQDLPPGADLIKLETFHKATRLATRDALQLGDFTLRRLIGTHLGACGYVITRRMAQAALADPRLNDVIVDAYLFARNGPSVYRRRVYQVLPALSVQLSRDPGRRKDSLASSDLEAPRLQVMRATRRPWARLRQNARSSLMDVRYFSGDMRGLLGPRSDIPFAPD